MEIPTACSAAIAIGVAAGVALLIRRYYSDSHSGPVSPSPSTSDASASPTLPMPPARIKKEVDSVFPFLDSSTLLFDKDADILSHTPTLTAIPPSVAELTPHTEEAAAPLAPSDPAEDGGGSATTTSLVHEPAVLCGVMTAEWVSAAQKRSTTSTTCSDAVVTENESRHLKAMGKRPAHPQFMQLDKEMTRAAALPRGPSISQMMQLAGGERGLELGGGVGSRRQADGTDQRALMEDFSVRAIHSRLGPPPMTSAIQWGQM